MTDIDILVKLQEVLWYPWTSEIIPDGQRGTFFGRLAIAATLIAMPASFLIGKFLDHHNDLLGFLVIFGVCGTIGALAGAAYGKIPDVLNTDKPLRFVGLGFKGDAYTGNGIHRFRDARDES